MTSPLSQYNGAIGAAIYAWESYRQLKIKESEHPAGCCLLHSGISG